MIVGARLTLAERTAAIGLPLDAVLHATGWKRPARLPICAPDPNPPSPIVG